VKSLKEELTPAQFRLSRLIALGKGNKEIAGILHLSENTIKRCLYQIFDRASISYHNRTSLAVRYVLEEEEQMKNTEGRTMICRQHNICAGHRVVGQGGHCERLHGHEYVFYLICSAPELDKVGRILDFSEIKDKLCAWLEDTWDHRMILWKEDPWIEAISRIDKTVWQAPFNPTVENLARYMVEVVGPQQLYRTGVTLVECCINETAKCSATYKI
jgi:6-pyruvoyltetrahydropterin/6-carboxytetrahydropterin synthase